MILIIFKFLFGVCFYYKNKFLVFFFFFRKSVKASTKVSFVGVFIYLIIIMVIFVFLSEFNMYYYHNNATGESQWEYPEQAVALSFPVSDLLQTNMGLITPASSFLPAQPMIAPPIPPMMMPVQLETMVSKAALPLVSPAHSFNRDSIPITNRKRQGIYFNFNMQLNIFCYFVLNSPGFNLSFLFKKKELSALYIIYQLYLVDRKF